MLRETLLDQGRHKEGRVGDRGYTQGTKICKKGGGGIIEKQGRELQRRREGVSQNDRGVSERLRVSEESRGFHRRTEGFQE